MAPHPTSLLSFDALRGSIAGRVILPADDGYDAARTVAYGGFDRHPSAIVRVANADDVARVIGFARTNEADLAVRCGGHSLAGHSVTEGGIVLDLTEMKGIDIDVEARTVWAEAGLTAGELSKATAEHGLAVPFGDTGTVGIGGITLGGGAGYLVRKHGLTIDSLLAAEIVTADGQLHHVDAETEPDLFWAIRGGGGNFGVVTRFQYRLHDVANVVGGILILPATPEVVARVVAAAHAAPRELSAIVNVMSAPPMPFLPPETAGKIIVMIPLAYVGDPAGAQAAIAPFRAIATPIADMVRPITYPQLFPPEGGDFHPAILGHTTFADSIDEGRAALIIERLTASDAMVRTVSLRILGGAVADVPADSTAYAHRSETIMVTVGAFFDGSAEDRARKQAWADATAAAIERPGAGAYVNFVGDEGEERVRAAYPDPTWERLVEIKRLYDPTNVFHLNQNIRP